jgi:peptidoglycan hydrolase-like protein with peptidoglycan-binding domain
MGRKTRRALKRFQADKGLSKTGKIDAATREALGFCVEPTGDKSAGAKSTNDKSAGDKSTDDESMGVEIAAAPPRPASDPQLQEVQRELAARGYDPGPADGLMGKKTREALKRFQTDNNLLAPSGSVDAQTLGALRSSTATTAKSGKTSPEPGEADAVPAENSHEDVQAATPAADNSNNPPPAATPAPSSETSDGSATPPAPAAAPEPSNPSSHPSP